MTYLRGARLAARYDDFAARWRRVSPMSLSMSFRPDRYNRDFWRLCANARRRFDAAGRLFKSTRRTVPGRRSETGDLSVRGADVNAMCGT